MKVRNVAAGLLLLLTLVVSSKDVVKSSSSNETIRICTTPDTRHLVESWTNDYVKNNPEFNFEIKAQNFSEFNNLRSTRTMLD